jgi:hypothetical protein
MEGGIMYLKKGFVLHWMDSWLALPVARLRPIMTELLYIGSSVETANACSDDDASIYGSHHGQYV